MGLLRAILPALLALAAGFLPAQPGRVRVAAAADLKWALEDAAAAFAREQPGRTCVLTFGSSGSFFAQLTQGAPFDVFLSADVAYPQRLVERGLARADTLFRYGQGGLVLWVPAASPVPIEQLGLASVRHPAVRKVAIANPLHAPYGLAAQAALQRAGMLEHARGKLVLGENVSQAAQFVHSGAADLGIIARSLALAPAMRDRGRIWRIPPELHPPLDQGGVVLARARDPEAALAFARFLAGPAGASIFAKHGFDPPGNR
ncbi:MAG: molybdate ABC transporter substrate-binding protein [Acidobacteria bacterium]|nr:molybdate ABC transporter substrate-binding protein [Acidobacteriota bacterium]